MIHHHARNPLPGAPLAGVPAGAARGGMGRPLVRGVVARSAVSLLCSLGPRDLPALSQEAVPHVRLERVRQNAAERLHLGGARRDGKNGGLSNGPSCRRHFSRTARPPLPCSPPPSPPQSGALSMAEPAAVLVVEIAERADAKDRECARAEREFSR